MPRGSPRGFLLFAAQAGGLSFWTTPSIGTSSPPCWTGSCYDLDCEHGSLFPGSARDAAMELPATLPNAEMEGVIPKLAEPLLISFECFDVFTDPSGQKLAADRKSVACRFQYRAADRTLKAEEVDAAHYKVL